MYIFLLMVCSASSRWRLWRYRVHVSDCGASCMYRDVDGILWSSLWQQRRPGLRTHCQVLRRLLWRPRHIRWTQKGWFYMWHTIVIISTIHAARMYSCSHLTGTFGRIPSNFLEPGDQVYLVPFIFCDSHFSLDLIYNFRCTPSFP